MKHALSVDVEEWHHGTSLAIPASRQCLLESRVVANTRRLLALFQERRARATFFVCGDVAVQHPELVREILHLGHEVGAHSLSHRLFTSLSPEECREEVLRSLDAVERAGGEPVKLFRAPSWSMQGSEWVLELLAERGVAIDSSMYPSRTLLFGIRGIDEHPHILTLGRGLSIAEFPPSVVNARLAKVPIGGGVFLRIAPSWLTRRHLRKLEEVGFPGMVYVHPWEVDTAPPWCWCSPSALFAYRFGLSRAYDKLSDLLASTDFTTLTDCLSQPFEKPVRVWPPDLSPTPPPQ